MNGVDETQMMENAEMKELNFEKHFELKRKEKKRSQITCDEEKKRF